VQDTVIDHEVDPGRGVSRASFSKSSIGSTRRWVIPSAHSPFKVRSIWPAFRLTDAECRSDRRPVPRPLDDRDADRS